MGSRAADVWISAGDGQLVAADSVTRLRCEDGLVQAMCTDGSWLDVAGPGCPPDFHLQLLGHIAKARRLFDDRWITVLAADGAGEDLCWTSVTADDLDNARREAAPGPRAIL
jgi:hypothetical protein